MPSGKLELSIEVRNGPADRLALVRAKGDVDLANAGELEGAIGSPECAASTGVVIDLRDVPFMDSSGLEVVLRAARGSERRVAVIVSEQSAVARLLELTGVGDLLRASATEEEALAAVDGGGSDG